MTMNSETLRVDVDVLLRLVRQIFTYAGCSSEEANQIAERLVASDLAGHPSHGVVRTLSYLIGLDEGTVVAGRRCVAVSDSGPIAILDGGYGFGQSLGAEAVQIGLAKAAEYGAGIVGLKAAGHLGRIADWAQTAAESNVVSLHFVNVSGKPLVAPFGAIDRRFGTDPIAIGIPQGDRPPILIDFATSVVAEGKARVALLGGARLPPDALITGDGVKTADPSVLYGTDAATPGEKLNPRAGDGALRAMGEQKGSALALACELLAGALIGSHLSGDETFANGMLSIYLDPERFANPSFIEQAVAFADEVRSAKPVDPGAPVVVPGDIERQREADQRANGVALGFGTWKHLCEAAARVSVPVPTELNG